MSFFSKYSNSESRSTRRFSFASLLMALVAVLSLSSCNGVGVYDDLEECPRGVIMRFVFDYNLEFANSFPSQVDCLSVFLFDKEGNLLERRTETSDVLADENWRMTFDLPAGDYQAVAYGGLECDMASFAHTKAIEDIKTIEDLEVLINEEHIGDEAARPERYLHDLFHGYLDFTVNEGITYDQATLKMMRDTNNIRIVLQHIDNSPVDDKDFRFEIVDDNIHFNYLNDVLPNKMVVYTPWTTGTADAGLNGLPLERGAARSATRDVVINPAPVQVAYAEMSVSRLMYDSKFGWTDNTGKSQKGPRLRILTADNGRIVCDLPLNNYLLLLKSEYFAKMPPQEFLDRANHYNLVFFLDHDNFWIRTTIIVDDWTVRIEDIKYE